MSEAAVLEMLAEQAEREGAGRVTLQALIEEASERGAERALAALGMEGPGARRDMDELRELLGAWREAKRSMWKAVAGWFVRLMLALLLVGMAVRTGLAEMLVK